MQSSALAGACAGLVSSVVTCPLDVVKTRLQAQEGRRFPPTLPVAPSSTAHPPIQYLGLASTIRKIYSTDGLRGFYRGLGPTIFGYLPTWAIYFTVYDNSKLLFSRYTSTESSGGEFVNHILSAMTAGAASTICTSPLWVVKTRFMLQSVRDKEGGVVYRHTGDAFRQIYKAEGLRGFYKGLLPSLFGVSHVAVQFPLYEAFKGWAREGKGEEELAPGEILVCSSSAKMIASVTTYPHEVLRTRLQMQPRNKPQLIPSEGRGRYAGVVQATKTIAREEGLRGFYKGMTVNLVRTVPSSALTILTYELIMQHLAQLDHQQDANAG